MTAFSINTNPASLIALESLDDINSQLDHAESVVSTGKKVNSAADNPAAFGIAQEIGGEIAGQNAVNDGLSYASSLVNTTTSAANSIMNVLIDLRQTVTSAGSFTGEQDSEDDINHQITGYLNQIDTISRSATSNGVNILAGDTRNGFDITSTSLSYVTSLEGNTANIGSAFDLIGESGDVKNSSGAPQTITQALGLTRAGGYNKTISNSCASANFLSSMLSAPSAGMVFQNGTVLHAAISRVNDAIKAMQYVTAKLGQNSRTISSLSSFGTKLGDNLTDEQGSLVDADMAKESAILTSLQVKQKLAIKALSIANEQSQYLLELFK